MNNQVCPFTIQYDTAEQKPWLFEGLTVKLNKKDIPLQVFLIKKHLQTGDYTIQGRDQDICIERKSIPDLIGTIVNSRDRFERELRRMKVMNYAAVVVEGSWSTAQRWCSDNTDMNPKSLDSSILTFMMRYPWCHWIFRPSRFAAMKTTYKIFDLYWRRILNAK